MYSSADERGVASSGSATSSETSAGSSWDRRARVSATSRCCRCRRRTTSCVGIGDALRRRGDRVVFIVEESFAGTLEARGFEERLMRLGPPPAEPEIPGQFWIDFIRDTAPVFRKTTIEQLGEFLAPTWQALIDGSKYVNPRLAEIFDEVDPDVIVEDNVVGFPAISASGRPWVRIVSCNPTEIKDALIAPFSSGYPVGDRGSWPG